MTTINEQPPMAVIVGLPSDVPNITSREELDGMMGAGFSKHPTYGAGGRITGEIGDVFDKPPQLHIVPAVAKPDQVRLPMLPTTEAPCEPCGARCCKNFPGVPHPEDLGAPDVDALRTKVRELLDTGNWIIDHDGSGSWLDHEPKNWFIRPRKVEEVGWRINEFRFAPPGVCALLANDRCSIYDERPRGCRTLVPSVFGSKECRDPRDKADQVDDWEPYESILLEEGYR